MRSRPDVRIALDPARVTPGVRLRVEVLLESRSDTPVEAVETTLRVIERRYSHTRTETHTVRRSNGSRSRRTTRHRVYKTHVHLAEKRASGPGTLSEGEHRLGAVFDLPPWLPPSFTSGLGSVRYLLDVAVRIPWWPDRKESYELSVFPAPAALTAAPPSLHATHPGGPRGEELYLEAALDPSGLVPGGALRGRVSAHNVRFHRLKEIRAALVAYDRARFPSDAAGGEAGRQEFVIREGAPAEGEPISFSLPLPPNALPSFSGALIDHVWQLELRGVVAWGSDVFLRAPLLVPPALAASPAGPPASRIPPVGRERRAAVWEAVARKHGLAVDAASEVMGAWLGGTSVRIFLEHRGEAGLFSVAEIDWPDLGLGLEARERRWTDALARRVETGDGRFDDRFLARAREAPQLLAFLSPALREALLAFPDVSLDDDGLVVAAPGGDFEPATLDAFVARALAATRAASAAAKAVPPPASMAALAPAWQAFAARVSAAFDPGGRGLRGVLVSGLPFAVRTEWSEDGQPARTVVEHVLEEGAPSEASPEAAAVEAGLRAELPGLEVSPRGIRASFPTPLADPSSLGPALEALARLARARRGLSAAGPYRG